MAQPTDISQPIIEALYCEALVLADEVRAAFDLAPGRERGEDLVRIALSVEGLRTTTRMMHVLAWLLNHRAYFSGELSEFQLRRHGVLPPDRLADPDQLALLEPETRALISETQALHQRIARLDAAWRDRFAVHPSAVLRLRERLGREISGYGS
jgi:regulator of CtrA degradation